MKFHPVLGGDLMKCKVTGILQDGKPLNIPTIWWVEELEQRIKKLEAKKE